MKDGVQTPEPIRVRFRNVFKPTKRRQKGRKRRRRNGIFSGVSMLGTDTRKRKRVQFEPNTKPDFPKVVVHTPSIMKGPLPTAPAQSTPIPESLENVSLSEAALKKIRLHNLGLPDADPKPASVPVDDDDGPRKVKIARRRRPNVSLEQGALPPEGMVRTIRRSKRRTRRPLPWRIN